MSDSRNSGPVLVERGGAVATVTLNDAEHGNRMSPLTTEAILSDEFRALSRDRTTRAIVLRAEGPDFCLAGHHPDPGPPTYAADADAGSVERLAHGYAYGVVWEALAGVTKPIIAAVRGRCEGGGLGLVLGCDLVVLGRSARLRATDVEAGRSLFSPMARTLTRAVGKHRAMELIVLGRQFGARDLAALDISAETVPDEDVEEEALRRAAAIAARPPLAVAFARGLVRRAVDEMADYPVTRSWAYHSISVSAGPGSPGSREPSNGSVRP
ncbi:enoyl-CoA hydratase/isomerase family protein [Nocardia sp. alder85J]|uniref:enoyl-CoA hydratase/isomerase family protein n=1 Tax=Nocardia sp. alder85J TaxID=2862949 RepID=UPI001CD36660|nr:enoyl-CoA hydratase/isomerase family protein [Nocardia sp. alder85J]MCX4095610.1 enoyl-CoA hydratase/isomerase family protein [Nocardia sp. alder85J]